MNVGKSIKIALAQCEKDQIWLAGKMGTTRQQISNWACTGRMRQERLEELASVFSLSVSAFISLGED